VNPARLEVFDRIIAAADKSGAATRELAAAVADARELGVTWAIIAHLAGLTSAQAAHYRWGR
jgi:hypothetical protein